MAFGLLGKDSEAVAKVQTRVWRPVTARSWLKCVSRALLCHRINAINMIGWH